MNDVPITLSTSPVVNALVGGVFIGLAASLLLLGNGRIFGISSIVAGAILPESGHQQGDISDRAWRIAIVAGLVCAGLLLLLFIPSTLHVIAEQSFAQYTVAGLLVGFGTQMGGGCTSGHGVCGISRFSLRSVLATITFILAGMLTVALVRQIG